MTLKRDLVCPNCDGRELWRIETMMERAPSSRQLEPIGILLERRFFGAALAHGTFETLICNSCGYTEWYAKTLGGLKHAPTEGVHFIQNDIDKQGPYR